MEITNQSGDAAAISPESPQQPVSLFRQININVFWLANQFHWNVLIAIVIAAVFFGVGYGAYSSKNLANARLSGSEGNDYPLRMHY